MDHTLKKIKRLVLQGNFQFTLKADLEMVEDGLNELDVLEAITNSKQIEKTLNSTNPKTGKKEKLYIIKGFTYDNILVYTKGKVDRNQFYILISSMRSL